MAKSANANSYDHDQNGKITLYDMHCHLDFAENAKDVGAKSADAGIIALDSTVLPSSYVSAKSKFSAFPNIYIALGLHPWWVDEGKVTEADLERFETLAQTTRFIGEIGLDFYGERKNSQAKQEDAFFRTLCACNSPDDGGKVIFVHAVHATTKALDLMDKCDTFSNNTVVFHWFQGSKEEFGRALSCGALFSINMRMLSHSRMREIAQAIPDDRLLLETDNPPHAGMIFSINMWRRELENTLMSLADLRGTPPQELAKILAVNSEACLL